MAQYRCTQCGSIIDAADEARLGTCPACGALFVFPNNFAQKAALYRRAADMRANCNFTAACNNYSRILKLDATETEAHWGYLLSKYGVELTDGRAVFHRVEPGSFIHDPSYQTMIQYCPGEARYYYEGVSRQIEARHAKMLEIGRKQGDFDLYIHCGEPDGAPGSQLAADVGAMLYQAGYKVFLPSTMLHGIPQEERDLYEMAVANRAGAMLVVASQATDFLTPSVQAPWRMVWEQRQTDTGRRLLSIYRGIRPEALPMELASLQAIDCGVPNYGDQVLNQINQLFGRRNRSAELNRQILEKSREAEDLLKKKKFSSAKEVFQRILKLDPEDARAYWGVFRCLTKDLSAVPEDAKELDGSYQRAIQFAQEPEKSAWRTSARALMQDPVWKDLLAATKDLEETAAEGTEALEAKVERVGLYTSRDSQRFGRIARWRELAGRDREVYALHESYVRRDAAAEPLFGAQSVAEEKFRVFQRISAHKSMGLCLPILFGIALFFVSEIWFTDGQLRIIADKNPSVLPSRILMTLGAVCLAYTLFATLLPSLKSEGGVKPLLGGCVLLIGGVFFLSPYWNGVIQLILAAAGVILLTILKLMDFSNANAVAREASRRRAAVRELEEIDAALLKAYEEKMAAIDRRWKVGDRPRPEYTVSHSPGFTIPALNKVIRPIAELARLAAALCLAAVIFLGAVWTSNLMYAGPWHDVEQIVLLDICRAAGIRRDGTVAISGYRGWNFDEVRKWKNIVQVVGGRFAAGLTDDGNVLVACSKGSPVKEAENWTDITSLSAFTDGLLGLRADGTAAYAGSDDHMRTAVSGWSDLQELRACATSSFTMAVGIRRDGRGLATDEKFQEYFDVAAGKGEYGFSIQKLYGNGRSFLIEGPDGRICGLGNNVLGSLSTAETWWEDGRSYPTDAYVFNFCAASWPDGTVTAGGAVGINWDVVSAWTDIVELEGNDDCCIYGLRSDGTVVATGVNDEGQLNVEDWTDIVHIAAGEGIVAGVMDDGHVRAAGRSYRGQSYLCGKTPVEMVRYWIESAAWYKEQ